MAFAGCRPNKLIARRLRISEHGVRRLVAKVLAVLTLCHSAA
ncbi:hypothetical protein SNL152K_5155 [Streptomyces sp. NL15-2K]|nr:hypothetical protein SNL152K_5155 [Streptomyces sp. NL15-2K]